MHVVGEDLSPRERADRARELKASLSHFDRPEMGSDPDSHEQHFRIRIETGEDVVQTIAEHSKDFDLLIIGASQESWLRRRVWGDTTHRVAAGVECPLMLVNLETGSLRYNISQFFEFFWDVEGAEEIE
jgi:nucleotide-binding universal stress UspA family protein